VPELSLVEVATGFDYPVAIESAPGDPSRLFVVQQSGLIRVIQDGVLLSTPFIDLTDAVIFQGPVSEVGLLGLAFHPDYQDNGRFFVHYAESFSIDNFVMEHRVSADPSVAEAEPVQMVIRHYTNGWNHNGGAVEFGPDGYLYLSIGDGGNGDDPGCDGQNLMNLLGKISRVDVEGIPDADGYPAPPDNPAGAKYYHIGLRNPWRMSFDSCEGDLYIGDVGQLQWEEIDLASPGSGPLNFGWPMLEGTHDHLNYGQDPPSSCVNPPTDVVAPIAEYSHLGGGCAVIGGVVYRGAAIPALRGAYLFSDFCTGALYALRQEDGVLTQAPENLGVTGGAVSAVGSDALGEVYVADYNGTIYRLEAR